MNISSISAPTPVAPPDNSAPKTPDVTPADDASAAQPPAQAPLPPGQGTRVNQLA